jgi:molybdenum cofactor biosynthesis enzyme MoaA
LKAIFGDLIPTYGYYSVEHDVHGHFVWAKEKFGLRGISGKRFYSAAICYYGDVGSLRIRSDAGWETEIRLNKGWNTYALDLPISRDEEIHIQVDPVIPVPTDSRDLGVMIRSVRDIQDNEAYGRLSEALENKRLNDKEFAQKRVVLESYPSLLRSATGSECNIVPRCVYCDWERAKHDEDGSAFILSRNTLMGMGNFFRRAASVGDLSVGEPFLNAEFASLVDLFHRWNKPFSLASNGQSMGPRIRQALLGKNIELYISMDAITDEGYRRYRNNKFDKMFDNLKALCRERKEHFNLPNVIVTCILMKSNKSQMESFLRRVKDVGVDGVRIMDLHPFPHLLGRTETRNGSLFVYGDEVLSRQEFKEAVENAVSLASKMSLPLVAVTQFESNLESGELPICSEPWKTINPLKQGPSLCCFNREIAVAKWSERQGRTVEQFLLDTWNGLLYQEIRKSLASGKLHAMCRRSGSCPIVQGLTNGGQTSLNNDA